MKTLSNQTKILLLSVCALVLASCSKYQVNVLSSSDTKKDEQTGMFVADNDSVKITYSFWGRNAPINISIYNKLNVPLYIDWQRSSFIEDSKAISYADDRVQINGDISGTAIRSRNLTFSSGSLDAIATLPKNVMFVPPHAQISKTLLEASGQYFNLPDSVFSKKEVANSAIDGSSTVRTGAFAKENSPLSFRSYLTLYTLDNNQPKFFNYQNDFFVSKVIKLTNDPGYYDYQNRGDYYFTKN